jgi:hypothetical protein
MNELILGLRFLFSTDSLFNTLLSETVSPLITVTFLTSVVVLLSLFTSNLFKFPVKTFPPTLYSTPLVTVPVKVFPKFTFLL